jgi:hypothetical protein
VGGPLRLGPTPQRARPTSPAWAPRRLQVELARQVVSRDAAEWLAPGGEPLSLVAGLDISFFPAAADAPPAAGPPAAQPPPATGHQGGRAVATLAVLSFPGLELRHSELLEARMGVPYVPGLLGFRWAFWGRASWHGAATGCRRAQHAALAALGNARQSACPLAPATRLPFSRAAPPHQGRFRRTLSS